MCIQSSVNKSFKALEKDFAPIRVLNYCPAAMTAHILLPRIDEINGDVDDTKYNKYFTQAANAVPVRMAILKTLIKNNPK